MSEQLVRPAPGRPKRRNPLAYFIRFQSLIGLVLVLAGGVVFSPRRHGHILFLAPDNVGNIIRSISETGIIALGMTFVIISAGIDLSVGAILGLCSVLTASLMINAGWGIAASSSRGAERRGDPGGPPRASRLDRHAALRRLAMTTAPGRFLLRKHARGVVHGMVLRAFISHRRCRG